MVFDFSKKQIQVHRKTVPMELTETRHPALSIFELGPGPDSLGDLGEEQRRRAQHEWLAALESDLGVKVIAEMPDAQAPTWTSTLGRLQRFGQTLVPSPSPPMSSV